MAGGEARDGEDLHRLAGQEWRQSGGGDSRITEGLCRQTNRQALVIAQRAVRADELADAMSAGRLSCVVGDMSDLLPGGRLAALRAHVPPTATAVSAVAGLTGEWVDA